MLVTYDAYLTIPALSPPVAKKIEGLTREFGLQIGLYPDAMEFSYSGKDTGRRLMGFLKALAPILGSADGEIECVVDENDDDDRVFEFYTIAGGKLYCDIGRIVRSGRKLVE